MAQMATTTGAAAGAQPGPPGPAYRLLQLLSEFQVHQLSVLERRAFEQLVQLLVDPAVAHRYQRLAKKLLRYYTGACAKLTENEQ